MLVEKNLKEALEYYIKGKPVTALWMGEDGSMNAMLLSDILDQPENRFLVHAKLVWEGNEDQLAAAQAETAAQAEAASSENASTDNAEAQTDIPDATE